AVYTIAGIRPKEITLEEIPYLYEQDHRPTSEKDLDGADEASIIYDLETRWWDQNLFRPFDNSKRDLKWFEMLECIREIAFGCGAAIRGRDGKIYTHCAWKDAEVYSVAFKQLMNLDWSGSWNRWSARDIFDAVNVVLCEADYNNELSLGDG